MSYSQFLLIFIGPPLLLGLFNFFKSTHPKKMRFLWGAFLLSIIALAYTTPWDNYLVKSGIWYYGPNRVFAVIGYVPIEEYAFFILQTVMTSMWCFRLHQIANIKSTPRSSYWKPIVSIIYFLMFLTGVLCLYFVSSRYLGLILAWASPVLLFQWLVGGGYLLKNLKIFIYSFLVPTAYLWFADAIAINDGIWTISSQFTLGLQVWTLPLEEAVFFLVTNLMTCQGLLLFIAMEEDVRVWFAKKSIQ